MNTLADRYEILFLYECKDCNPNGDPLDENRPRTDPETGEATVTDVRIKRTVRDYFLAQKADVEERLAAGMEILIRDTLKPDGHLSEGKDRAEQFLTEASKGIKGEKKRQAIQEAVLRNCIDARLFGAALPLGRGEPSVQLTGPVQFSAFNRSLHRVTPVMVQQTAAYAGSAKANQKSFAERWLLPYALIAAYGVVNEVAARTTQMTDEDLTHLIKALWQGTADLNTHSKIGHDPLLLILARYEPGHRIGALPRMVRLTARQSEDTALRSTEDYRLDASDLLAAFKECEFLTELQVVQNNRLHCQSEGKQVLFMELAKQDDLPVTKLGL
jgi:CRISPR-associated protein Csh2